ncbi:hypothetical protein DPMN_079089 [Dreissena polymorpha]|uniref:NOMO-like ninth beta-sandwich domain-containing protein n=1 Tax=Dreissena polymorpha TaxID=45954 RepID=A0A9D3YSH2_DREPO|nr:hypothetical protein DPMN_079089 [Dreissena polymorpha]
MFKFVGERGQFIVGHVVPKLTGVKIVVSDPKGTMEPVVDYTSENGDFKFVVIFTLYELVIVISCSKNQAQSLFSRLTMPALVC